MKRLGIITAGKTHSGENTFTRVLEKRLISHNKYGNHSLDAFGCNSYQGSLTSIMLRSFLTVKYLVEERAGNDPKYVFRFKRSWDISISVIDKSELLGDISNEYFA